MGRILFLSKSLFEKYICRVRTAHHPLKAPEGIKRLNRERDRDLTGVKEATTQSEKSFFTSPKSL